MTPDEAATVIGGDTVCDCRELHLKVMDVIVTDEVYEGITRYRDIDLLLEDGSMASAVHCCDKVPHKYKHQS